jgi:hypothetical protein
MEEPEEVTDRRSRFNLMAAIEAIAAAKEVADLHDTELLARFDDCLSSEGVPWGECAMTPEELTAIQNLHRAIDQVCDNAFLIKRDRIGGKVVHGLDPDDLASLGWFESVQPLAREALATFSARGWLDHGLWAR